MSGDRGGHAPMSPVAIVCQGAAILAGASPVEAARVWQIVAPMDIPRDPGSFAVIVRAALTAVQGQGQGADMSAPVGSWWRGPGGSLFLRIAWHDAAAGIVTGWHRRGWGRLDPGTDPPGFPAGYTQIGEADALGV